MRLLNQFLPMVDYVEFLLNYWFFFSLSRFSKDELKRKKKKPVTYEEDDLELGLSNIPTMLLELAQFWILLYINFQVLCMQNVVNVFGRFLMV